MEDSILKNRKLLEEERKRIIANRNTDKSSIRNPDINNSKETINEIITEPELIDYATSGINKRDDFIPLENIRIKEEESEEDEENIGEESSGIDTYSRPNVVSNFVHIIGLGVALMVGWMIVSSVTKTMKESDIINSTESDSVTTTVQSAFGLLAVGLIVLVIFGILSASTSSSI